MSRLPGQISNSDYLKISELYTIYVMGSSDAILPAGADRIGYELNAISNTISQRSFVSKLTQLFNSAAGGIHGFTLYPCDIELGAIADVKINTVQVADSEGKNLHLHYSSDVVDSSVGFELQVPYSPENFMSYEPYTTYKMYIPFIGIIDLQSIKIYNKKLKLNYHIDLHTGGAEVTLDNGEETLFAGSAQLGVTVPFGFTDEGQRETARVLNALKAGASVLSAGFGAPPVTTTTSSQTTTPLGAVATGSKTIQTPTRTTTESYQRVFDKTGVELASGTMDTKSSTTIKGGTTAPVKAAVQNSIVNLLPDRATATITGGGDYSIFSQPMTPYLIRINPHIHDINNYGRYFGYACAEEITLNEHSGYCVLSNIHMEGLPDMMEDESNAIEKYLKTGVILP